MRVYASQLFPEDNIKKMPTRRAILATVVVLAFGLIAAATSAQAIIYVDDDAPLGGDGATWSTAFTYLQDALLQAVNGDEIRVAGGVYTPDQDEGGNVTPGDRTATFQLITGVALRGGYAGLAKPDLRDIDLYETILSGDLTGDDGSDFARNEENSIHVVNASGTDATTVMDGITVTAGNADDANLNPEGFGGGLYNLSGSPAISRCTFQGNAAVFGGGMSSESLSSPTLTNCVFSDNLARAGGGIFERATIRGPTTLTNCVFTSNEAVGIGKFGSGGAIHASSVLVMTNCVFFDNSAETLGGAINGFVIRTLTNCIVWGNSPTDSQLHSRFDDTGIISFSCIEGGFDGKGNIDVDPLLSADGKNLQAASPCIDAGDPGFVPTPGETDLNGHPRVLCGRVDMGASEFGIGDHDCNRAVNLLDFAAWQDCMTGPGGGPYSEGCEALDFDADGEITLRDFAGFQREINGS